MLPFTKEEYQERVQKVKSTMAEEWMCCSWSSLPI